MPRESGAEKIAAIRITPESTLEEKEQGDASKATNSQSGKLEKGEWTEMLEITVVKKGVVKVDFGVKGDPQRIATIAGEIPHYYVDLDPGRFEPEEDDPEPWCSRAGLAAWPESVVEKEVMVLKPNRFFLDYAQLKTFVDESADFEHLLFPWLTAVPLWADELHKAGIWWVAATDPDSLRREIDRNLRVPCFFCSPVVRGLGSFWFVGGWSRSTGVLVCCK